MLTKNGFTRLSERKSDEWNIAPNGKYFFTRNQSSVVAFAVGGKWAPGNGFAIIGAHTDSPVLKLKPVSKITKGSALCVGVECYGGGLWHTWWDRDLSVAGRVIVAEADGTLRSRLVQITQPILRIPNLAIHLNRDVATGFSFNTETQLVPILATVDPTVKFVPVSKPGAASTCSSGACSRASPASASTSTSASSASTPEVKKDEWVSISVAGGSAKTAADNKAYSVTSAHVTLPSLPTDASLGLGASNFPDQHHSLLMDLIAKSLGVEIDSIRDFELCLYDTQPAQITGIRNEFVSSRALDNLMMSFCSTDALIQASTNNLNDATQIFMTALFDNEEVGSVSMMGAGSSVMSRLLQRLNGYNFASTYDAAIARSILVSADMAHAWHPNYMEKHEENHRPIMQRGLVIKYNGNMRYATSNASSQPLLEIAHKYNIPTQQFCVRNDSSCGSTIGPMLSASCGIRTVDVGIPQWAMHSIRETCGIKDVASAIQLFKYFYAEFASVDAKLKFDDQ